MRRPLLALAGVVAIALAVVVGIIVVNSGDEPLRVPAPTVPPLGPAPTVSPSPTEELPPEPGPVLVLPGYGGSTGVLGTLADGLRAEGREVQVVRLPDGGRGDIREQAQVLDEAADAALAGGAESVDVIGYSAGGVVARTWAAELGGDSVARRIVTLGSPHHGTAVAAAALATAPSQCPLACQQLVAGSDLLTEINAGDETPEGPEWVSIWTDRDQVVRPPSSSDLEGAVNIQTEAVCADANVDHGSLPTAPLVVGIVVDALTDEALEQVPGPEDCADLRELGSGSGD